MANLTLVPPGVPDRKAAMLARIKATPKPDGMMQCNRCGSRTTVTVRNGSRVIDGRISPGTLLHKDICADCFKLGIICPTLPELRPIK